MSLITLSFIVGTLFGTWIGEAIFSKTEVVTKTEYVYIDKPTEKRESSKPTSNSLGVYEVTAYCACSSCCGKSDGVTASGTQATAGRTIAADTNVLPFGTKVKINGIIYTVEDRGGAIKGNRIDIYFDSHEEALAFGRQRVEVFKV